MSNEMISVPHWAEIEAAMWGAFADGSKKYRGCTRERLEELHALLAKPAKQHQAEPVAYEKPCDYWLGYTGHINYKDPADLKRMISHLEGLLDAIPDGPLYTCLVDK